MIAIQSKRRRGIFVSVSIATALLATSSTHAIAKGKRDRGDQAQTLAFIAETRVVAPLQVGEFVLEGNRRYDEHDKFGGVSFRYQHPHYPHVRFDLFVYPVGQADPEQALKTGMRHFAASMQPAIDAGVYRNFVEGETIEFDLDLPLHDGVAAQDTNASKEDAADQLMRDMLEASVRSETSNCHARADEAELSKLAEGASMETFTYSTTDWNGK